MGGQLLALSVAAPVVWHHHLLDELRGVRYHLALNKVFVDPEVVVSADKFAPGLMQTAIVGFNLSHATPQLPDMVPFEDTRLPHRVVRGNAQLGNIQKVKAYASFSKRMSKHQRHFVSSIEFCNTQGAPTTPCSSAPQAAYRPSNPTTPMATGRPASRSTPGAPSP